MHNHKVKDCWKLQREKEQEAKGGTTASPPKPAATTKVAVANAGNDVVHLFSAAAVEPMPCDNVAFTLWVHTTKANQHWIVKLGMQG